MKNYLLAFCFLFVLGSCLSTYEADDVNQPVQISTKTNNLNSIEQEITDYYNNLFTMFFLTDAFQEPLSLDSYDQQQDEFVENPLSFKIANEILVDDETEEEISFFDLNSEDQRIILAALLQEEKEEKLQAIQQYGFLSDGIVMENSVMSALIDNYSIPQLSLDSYLIEEETENGSFSQNVEINSGIIPVIPEDPIMPLTPSQGLSVLRESISDAYENRYAQAEEGLVSGATYASVNPLTVRMKWALSSVRGNFVVALPQFYDPRVLYNYNNPWKVGHAAVIDVKPSLTTLLTHKVTTESWNPDGVIHRSINDWGTAHYLMGVQTIRRRVRWSGLRTRIVTERTPVTNPSLLADYAAAQNGKPYASGVSFVISKAVAPNKFTCTTLVWWCAKKAYGLNLSNWLSPIVTPSDLFTSPYTYVIRSIS